jgi:hypothetical protein
LELCCDVLVSSLCLFRKRSLCRYASCKYIANCVRKVGLAKLAGKAGSTNVQGEDQMKLDVIAHEVGGLYKLNAVTPVACESAWFQPLNT